MVKLKEFRNVFRVLKTVKALKQSHYVLFPVA